ncbi:unnamed protein product [Musa acuminata subsp. burmannicoides]
MEGSGDDPDHSVERRKRKRKPTGSPADDLSKQHRGAAMTSPSADRRKLSCDDALEFLVALKEGLDPDKYEEFLDTVVDMKEQSSAVHETVERLKELLRISGLPESALALDVFVPKGWDAPAPSVSEKKPDYRDALAHVRRVRSRFSNNEAKYTSFLDIFRMHRTDRKPMDQVHEEVMALFQGHDDLLEEYSFFFNHGSERKRYGIVSSSGPFSPQDEERPTNSNDAPAGEKEGRLSLYADCHLSNLEHSKSQKYVERHSVVGKDQRGSSKMCMVQKETHKNLNNLLPVQKPSQRFDHCVAEPPHKGHRARLVDEEEIPMDMDHEGDGLQEKLSENDRIRDTKRLFGGSSVLKDKDPCKNNLFGDDEECDHGKGYLKPDTSKCHRSAPGYVILPDHCHILPPSYMSEIGSAVLNDSLVCMTSGSENNSFKIMHWNKYEECLIRCDDDRFELDMLLKLITVTAKRVEMLLKVKGDKVERESDIPIENYFTSQDLRCIELLYDEYGLDFIDAVRENVSSALPVILNRLKQKEEEILEKLSDFSEVWTEAQATNHLRSLDHRSFYFKQQDPKTLSSKALLAECKQVNEMDDNMLLDRIAGGHFIPVVFEYTDAEIHDVLYKIIELSCHAYCTLEGELDKVMNIWTTFFEPMFGVFWQLQDTESNKENKKHDYRSSLSSSGQCSGGSDAEVAYESLISGHTSNLSVICTQIAKEQHENFEGGQNQESVVDRTCGDPIRFNDKVHQCNEVSAICNNEDEKEEGELSPEVYFEENIVVDSEGIVMDKLVDDGTEGRQFQLGPGALTMDFVVDAEAQVNGDAENEGIESALGPFKDSPNAHEAVVDASHGQCDDNDVQESSHDNEEEDEIDHDAKGGSVQVDKMSDDADNFQGEGTNLPFSACQLKTSKPLTEHTPRLLHNEDRQTRIFYGSTSFYLLLKIHQILYKRILSAKTNSSAAEIRSSNQDNANHHNQYARFKDALYSYLGGLTDKSNFEDDCLAFVGPQSYILSTLDILVHKLVKQLKAVAISETNNKFLQLYAYEKSRGPGRFDDLVYLQNARVINNGDLFRFECSFNPTRISIQLLEHPNDETEAHVVPSNPDFAAYFYSGFLQNISDEKGTYKGFLRRNIRKFHKYYKCNCDGHCATCEPMERIQVTNGLQCRILNSSKVLYVMGTEDLLFRKEKRNRFAYKPKRFDL